MSVVSTGITLQLLSVLICYFAADVSCRIPDCSNCSTTTTCTKCRPGFGTANATYLARCFPCSKRSGCSLCTTLTQCTTCNTTVLAPKKDTSGECAPCASNCRYCASSGPGLCDTCDVGYTRQSNKTCTAIPCKIRDCSACRTPEICARCRPGFGTPTPNDHSKCIGCNSKGGCAKCSAYTQCTLCNYSNFAPMKDSSGECAACAPNCLKCSISGPGKCDFCSKGYTVQNGACAKKN